VRSILKPANGNVNDIFNGTKEMKKHLIAFCMIMVGIQGFLAAQMPSDRASEKLEKARTESWPPERIHGRSSLGYALQQVFKRHVTFCGFKVADSGRDFVPPDIARFLGQRNLRTTVEVADISGGGLLNYVFHETERYTPFPAIRFSPAKVLRLPGTPQPFVVHPDEHFDSFILTKTCGGYLKSALDAGFEPPYLAFKSALDTDARRESSVMALSGSFLSPLQVAFSKGDRHTAEAYMKLWQFYREFPEYIGKAYYLREFQGVVIKHIATAEENARIESEISFNLNGLLPARLKGVFGGGSSRDGSFSGTDWQTILFADFDAAYRREALFAPLPTPAEIRRYFEEIRPMAYLGEGVATLVEGVPFRHIVELSGVPQEMSAGFWEIEQLATGCFEQMPALDAAYFTKGEQYGCRIVLSGRPSPGQFMTTQGSRAGLARLSYVIRSKQTVGGEYIRIRVNAEAPTSIHPLVSMGRGEFNIGKKENKHFSLQWQFEVEVEDGDNPVDFSVVPLVDAIDLRDADGLVAMRIADLQADPMRKRFLLTIETVQTWPLDRIDDQNLRAFNLCMDMHLKSRRSNSFAIRNVQGNIFLPGVKTEAIVPKEVSTGGG